MADVSHELGSLRFVVDSPLSSKVAMFNNQANQHVQSQLLNPFSGSDGRVSPKPQFSKDEYGKPLAGSLTEMRGQRANIHVMKEMLELCQIIDSEGYSVKDEPTMRVIPFGELFNIYNYISDKVVGILLRARKHKLVQFEGEMLFQRRDDDVPVFLLRPIQEIRKLLELKIEEIKRASSPAPQATSVLMQKHSFACSASPSPAPSRTTSRAPTPPVPVAAPDIFVNDIKNEDAEALPKGTETEPEPVAGPQVIVKETTSESEVSKDALPRDSETLAAPAIPAPSCESTEKSDAAEQAESINVPEPKTEMTIDSTAKNTEAVTEELQRLPQSVENSPIPVVHTADDVTENEKASDDSREALLVEAAVESGVDDNLAESTASL